MSSDPDAPGPEMSSTGRSAMLLHLPFRLAARARTRMQRWDRWFWGVLIAMAVYAVAYSLVAYSKYLSLSTYAWDLGIYNQVMWSLVSGNGFHYTVEYFINPSGNYMAQHFAPDLLLIAPIYALVPFPVTLLVIQSGVIALGAYPVWLLARSRGIAPKGSALLAWSYLLFAPVWGANWYDFHLETFFIPAMLFVVYFWMRHRWPLFWAAILVGLFTVESASFFVAFFGVTLILVNLRGTWALLRRPRSSPIEHWMPFMVIAVSICYFITVRAVQHALNPVIPAAFEQVYQASANWSLLGISNPLDPLQLLQVLLLHPGHVWTALSFDLQAKILYLSFFLAPLLLLPLRKVWWLIPAVPWFVALLLSNYPPYFVLGYQYASFLIPWFFVAAIFALKLPSGDASTRSPSKIERWMPWTRAHPRHLLGATPTFFLVVTFCLVAFPALSSAVETPAGFSPALAYHTLFPNRHTTAVWTLIELIPPTASVVTQSNLFPPLSSRENAYVIPYVSPIPTAWALDASHTSGPPQYVLFDPASDSVASAFMNSTFISPGGYGLRAQAGTAVLYEWGYSGTVETVED